LHVPAAVKLGGPEKLHGPQAAADSASYQVWQKTDEAGGNSLKYLVDDSGAVAYLVDPGINGVYTKTPGGTGPVLVAKLFENFYTLNS